MEPKHYVCAVIWRTNKETGRKEALVQKVTRTFKVAARGGVQTRMSKPQVVFVGGMQRMPDDSFEVTLTREIVEETYLRYSGELIEIGDPISVPDQENPGQIHHVKHAFLVPFEECTGELRTETITDDGDTMEPPYWVPIDEVGRELYHTHQPFRTAAAEALEWM